MVNDLELSPEELETDLIPSYGTIPEDESFLENHKGAGEPDELDNDIDRLNDALEKHDIEEAKRHKEDDFSFDLTR